VWWWRKSDLLTVPIGIGFPRRNRRKIIVFSTPTTLLFCGGEQFKGHRVPCPKTIGSKITGQRIKKEAAGFAAS
jgi:hypothetical protein